MLDIMEEFEKDRKEEKNFYALINFFKLIIVGRLCEENSDLFAVLEGKQKLDKLIRDIEEENINLYDNSFSSLYRKMCNLSIRLKDMTTSQSFPLLEAQKEFNNIVVISDYYKINTYNNPVRADYVLLSTLPSSINMESEVKEVLQSTRKQKTVGERK